MTQPPPGIPEEYVCDKDDNFIYYHEWLQTPEATLTHDQYVALSVASEIYLEQWQDWYLEHRSPTYSFEQYLIEDR